jgi:hypothetical protein
MQVSRDYLIYKFSANYGLTGLYNQTAIAIAEDNLSADI